MFLVWMLVAVWRSREPCCVLSKDEREVSPVPAAKSKMIDSVPVAFVTAYQHGSETHEPSPGWFVLMLPKAVKVSRTAGELRKELQAAYVPKKFVHLNASMWVLLEAVVVGLVPIPWS